MVATFINEAQDQIWLTFAVFLRIGPAISLAPGYGEASTPARVRLVLALALSVATVPIVESSLPKFDFTPEGFFLFVLSESIIGFFLGLFARGIILLIQQAGIVMSQTASLAQIFGSSADVLPIFGHVLTVAALAVIMAGPLGQQIILYFVFSYSVVTPNVEAALGVLAEKSTDLLASIFANGVTLAGGFVGLFLVYYLFTGFVNKSMPQFMVSFVGVPFVALFSIFYLYWNAEIILLTWQEKALTMLMLPFESLR